MSANRDKDQKIKFVYSNLYQIHSNKQNEQDKEIAFNKLAPSSRVIKAEDLNSGKSSVKVTSYVLPEMIGKRVERPSVIPARKAQAIALEGLKENLKTLNDLQARLRFMLKELEELIEE